jgi:hypothetical protein
MKRIVILLIALALSTFVMAQEKAKVKELGLTFRNLDQFGFSYKVGTEQSLWRFNAISLSGNSESENLDDNDRDSNHFGLGFSVGKEYRKLIAKNFEYRYGFDVSFDYNHSKRTEPLYNQNYNSSTTTSDFFTPGFNLVFGVNYIIGEHLVMGAEIMPYFRYTFGETSQEVDEHSGETDLSNFRYGFDSSSVLLSLAYRF